MVNRAWRARAAIFLLTTCAVAAAWSAVRQEQFYSALIKKTMAYRLFLPSSYGEQVRAGKRFAVVYLLHALGRASDSWTDGVNGLNPQVDLAIDSVAGLVAAAPDDGSGSSWWLDNSTGDRISTFLVTEFKHRIDSMLATKPDRQHTGVCGVSMGGYGALHNCSVHPETFGAVWGIVAVTDLAAHQNQLAIENVLGPYEQNTASWNEANVISNITRFKNSAGGPLHIGFQTNENDFLKEENVRLHAAFDSAGIAHEFVLYPAGGHQYPDLKQMVSILRFFEKNLAPAAVDFPRAPAMRRKPAVSPSRFSVRPVMYGGSRVVVIDADKKAGYTVNGSVVKKYSSYRAKSAY